MGVAEKIAHQFCAVHAIRRYSVGKPPPAHHNLAASDLVSVKKKCIAGTVV